MWRWTWCRGKTCCFTSSSWRPVGSHYSCLFLLCMTALFASWTDPFRMLFVCLTCNSSTGGGLYGYVSGRISTFVLFIFVCLSRFQAAKVEQSERYVTTEQQSAFSYNWFRNVVSGLNFNSPHGSFPTLTCNYMLSLSSLLIFIDEYLDCECGIKGKIIYLIKMNTETNSSDTVLMTFYLPYVPHMHWYVSLSQTYTLADCRYHGRRLGSW